VTGKAVSLVLVALAASSCSPCLSAARDYTQRGQHEIAVYYYANHFRDRRDAEAKVQLVRGFEAAVADIDADHAAKSQQADHTGALGAAIRQEELLDHARVIGLGEFMAIDPGRLTRTSLSEASAQALRSVDRAEADARPAQNLAGLLRVALALDPHNPELAQRYASTLSGLMLKLAPRLDCEAGDLEACRSFLGQLMDRLSQQRLEFNRLVPGNSDKRNAELVAHVSISGSDSGWRRTKAGEAEGKIEVRNRFNKVKKNAEGKKISQTVYARYEVFERTARATVQVKVVVKDLRPKGGVPFETSRTVTQTDRRAYVSWTGDGRALGKLKRHGTDRSPPRTTADLARLVLEKLADEIASQALAKLEGVNP
jgi:hypothetical protein